MVGEFVAPAELMNCAVRFYKYAAPTALKPGRARRRETISPFRRRAFRRIYFG